MGNKRNAGWPAPEDWCKTTGFCPSDIGNPTPPQRDPDEEWMDTMDQAEHSEMGDLLNRDLLAEMQKVAHAHPETRKYLVPLLRKTANQDVKVTERVATRYLTAGASDFAVFMKGTNAKKLFSDAVQDARYESGSGGYTGTIAEKSGFRIISEPKTRTQAEEIVWGSGRYNNGNNDKWGDAWAIPVAKSKVVMDKVKVMRVKAKNGDEAREKAVEFVKANFKGRKGAVQTFKAGHSPEMVVPGGVPTVDSAKSSERPYYQVATSNGGFGVQVNQALKFAKPGDAVKAIQEVAKTPQAEVGNEWFVYQIVPKATLKLTKKAAKLPTWEVKVQIVQEMMGKVEGYYFYGMASS